MRTTPYSAAAAIGCATKIALLAALLPLLLTSLSAAPAGIDHKPWDELLRKRVDDRGLVDYRGWHASVQDRQKLEDYLSQFAPGDQPKARGDEEIAALINAYNAFTISFILDHFPTESIRALDSPFGADRHPFDGDEVSLDHIEHKLLRPIIGWKAHSVVVCAARSCPPLLNRAYFAEDWEGKMRERYRAWLAREDLNRYFPEEGLVRLSKIFSWYSGDFKGDHSVKSILARFGPDNYKAFLHSEDYRIRYLDYHWGLNAQSDLGKDYEFSFLRSLF